MNFIDENQPQVLREPKKSKFLKVVVPTIVFLLLLASVGAAVYFYKEVDTLKKNANNTSQSDTTALVNAVGKLILLPTGETPTVATVSDLSALQGQAFFANAKVGDKVLVYQKAKTAFLYDPAQNKIINVSPISDQPATANSSTTANSQSQVSGSSTKNSPKN
jgi:hypothetical protein